MYRERRVWGSTCPYLEGSSIGRGGHGEGIYIGGGNIGRGGFGEGIHTNICIKDSSIEREEGLGKAHVPIYSSIMKGGFGDIFEVV